MWLSTIHSLANVQFHDSWTFSKSRSVWTSDCHWQVDRWWMCLVVAQQPSRVFRHVLFGGYYGGIVREGFPEGNSGVWRPNMLYIAQKTLIGVYCYRIKRWGTLRLPMGCPALPSTYKGPPPCGCKDTRQRRESDSMRSWSLVGKQKQFYDKHDVQQIQPVMRNIKFRTSHTHQGGPFSLKQLMLYPD